MAAKKQKEWVRHFRTAPTHGYITGVQALARHFNLFVTFEGRGVWYIYSGELAKKVSTYFEDTGRCLVAKTEEVIQNTGNIHDAVRRTGKLIQKARKEVTATT